MSNFKRTEKKITIINKLYTWERFFEGKLFTGWGQKEVDPTTADKEQPLDIFGCLEDYDPLLFQLQNQMTGKGLYDLATGFSFQVTEYKVLKTTSQFIWIENIFATSHLKSQHKRMKDGLSCLSNKNIPYGLKNRYHQSAKLRVDRLCIENQGWFYNKTHHKLIYRTKELAETHAAYVDTWAMKKILDRGKLLQDAESILELSGTLTPGKIKSAYRKIVKKVHPDHGGNYEEFQKVQNAYEVLSKQYGNKI
jgi:DnaJ domain